ncbi:type IV secretory system conjugative DNA transfer family protein [Tolypothrix sp. PCC 7910]|uniref:type IV secretory system conjugative DNA transfer family protein n=1 Tax=Tolypothrix sp. PCC 7910 TaxID=2099387 RepID=UPI002112585D|nr:TraM recognition domain-containing protein [Tolypothrix sp. PCC 7910]
MYALYPHAVHQDYHIWNDAAALVTSAIGESLVAVKGLDWGLHDIYHYSLAILQGMREILSQSELGKTVDKFIFEDAAPETTASVIFNQMVTLMKQIRLPAAHQYHTPKERWLSLRSFLEEGEGVLVIAPDLESPSSSFPVMAAMLQRIIEFASVRENRKVIDTFVEIDEFPLLPRAPSFPMLPTFLRGKGVHLTAVAQTLTQIKTVWKDEADTIINNCGYVIALHTRCDETARWLTNVPGVQRTTDINASYSVGGSGASYNEQEQVVERTAYTTYDFKQGLPKSNPSIGLHYYLYCHEIGDYVRGHIPPEEVDRLQPPEDTTIPARMPTPASFLTIPSVSPEELLAVLSATRWDGVEQEFLGAATTAYERSLRQDIIAMLKSIVGNNIQQLKDILSQHTV